MSFRRADNVFSTILSDVTVATSTLPPVGTVVTDSNIPAGAVVMTDIGMRRTTLATLATGDSYFIVQGKGAGNQLMKSPVIVKGNEAITTSAHVPSVQQITTIGYNGTTGALPTANDTSYYIKIRKNDNDAGNRSHPFSLFGQYTTSAAGTQEELAFQLSSNLIKNLSKEPTNYIDVDMLMDEAGAANTGAGTITTTYGSTQVTFGTDVDAVAVVGDYIRFDESAGASPAVTDPVYKVIAIDATNEIMTLDRGYTGTALAAVAEGNAVVVANATAIAAEFGIQLTGVQAPFDVNKFRDYYVNRFTATFSDEGATLVTATQGARTGTGMWQQVAMDEYMSYGYEGQNEMLAVPPTYRDGVVKMPGVGSDTALTSKYSTINIAWSESINGLVSTGVGSGSVLVHLNLEDSAGSGILDTVTANTGETLAAALGLTPADLDE